MSKAFQKWVIILWQKLVPLNNMHASEHIIWKCSTTPPPPPPPLVGWEQSSNIKWKYVLIMWSVTTITYTMQKHDISQIISARRAFSPSTTTENQNDITWQFLDIFQWSNWFYHGVLNHGSLTANLTFFLRRTVTPDAMQTKILSPAFSTQYPSLLKHVKWYLTTVFCLWIHCSAEYILLVGSKWKSVFLFPQWCFHLHVGNGRQCGVYVCVCVVCICMCGVHICIKMYILYCIYCLEWC